MRLQLGAFGQEHSSMTHHYFSWSHMLNEGFLWHNFLFSSSLFLSPVTPLSLSITSRKRDLRINKAVTGFELAYLCGPERLASLPTDRTHIWTTTLQTSADFQGKCSVPSFFFHDFILTWCFLLLVDCPCDHKISHGGTATNRSDLHHWTHHNYILPCWMSWAGLSGKPGRDYSYAAVQAQTQLHGEMGGRDCEVKVGTPCHWSTLLKLKLTLSTSFHFCNTVLGKR